MRDISLDDGTINVDGQWLSVEDLAGQIQERMESGDMQLTGLAEALEELNQALENSHTLEVRLVITKDEYEKLKALGGEDDKDCVRQSIMTFIGGEEPSETVEAEAPADDATEDEPEADASQDEVTTLTVNCAHPQCMSPIEITTDERPVMVECPNCGTNGWIMEDNQWGKPEKK
ncbi:hypothetical protein ACFLZL_01695 [Thermodesulfobacteriota bacterium]